MADQSISCPSCGKKIPLTRALRAEIEASVKEQLTQTIEERERELNVHFERRLVEEIRRAEQDSARKAGEALTREIADLQEQVRAQAKRLDEAHAMELQLRRRERELEQQARELELSVARKLDGERARLVADARQQLLDEHRLKDAEKERQLADMRRQIEELRRKAEQGSQQAQGEAGEVELETMLRGAFPYDDISPVAQGIRGADLHQVVVDSRGARCGSMLWEVKNTRHWSDGWLAKLREDQRSLRADVALLVTAALPKGCSRFAIIDGIVVSDFSCAGPLAAVFRNNLIQLAQARTAASTRGEKLELLHRYLSGVEFRQRVEAIVEAFARMRDDLEQERRAAERQWAKRAKQIEMVTFNISGMYGDLQGLVPALPSIARLELPSVEAEEEVA